MLDLKIAEFANKQKYDNFFQYMVLHSNSFSFEYFKKNESEHISNEIEDILKILEPYTVGLPQALMNAEMLFIQKMRH